MSVARTNKTPTFRVDDISKSPGKMNLKGISVATVYRNKCKWVMSLSCSVEKYLITQTYGVFIQNEKENKKAMPAHL